MGFKQQSLQAAAWDDVDQPKVRLSQMLPPKTLPAVQTTAGSVKLLLGCH